MTYGELAARIGKPKAARAVGTALGANPVPLLVPCHRVVSTTGLGGFTGGLHIKKKLLCSIDGFQMRQYTRKFKRQKIRKFRAEILRQIRHLLRISNTLFVNPFENLLSTELLFALTFKVGLQVFQCQGVEICGFIFEWFCDVVVSIVHWG
jgi:O-6-methylguanine DNA methyltransferase